MYDVKKKPTKLKPCPFCGDKAIIDRVFGPVNNPEVGRFAAQCMGKRCGIIGPIRDSVRAASAAWNRRKP